MYTIRYLPDLISSRTFFGCADPRKQAGMLDILSWSTWSSIKEIRGEMTRPILPEYTGGYWKHKLFPYPVAITTTLSLLSSKTE